MMQEIEGSPVSIPDVITLSVRLAQILAQEVDLLQDMKVSAIEPLQKEKLLLIGALEAQKKTIEKNPALLEDIDPQHREDLREVVEVIEVIMTENHRQLLMAKEVNLKVVEAITDVVTESAINGLYDKHGTPEGPGRDTFSVTLDKKV